MAAGVVTRPSRRSADEDRLSTKAVPRGKEKIVEPTANAAQEMHRISTGATRVSFRRGTRLPSILAARKDSRPRDLAGRARKLVDSQRIASQKQVVLFDQDEIGHHAGPVGGICTAAGRKVIGVIEVHQ